MSKVKDPNYIASLEKSISEKYGESAILHPKKFWNEEKEEKYMQMIKEAHQKEQENSSSDKSLINNEERNNKCLLCNKYLLTLEEELYLLKFECCKKCYIQYVEGREGFWKVKI